MITAKQKPNAAMVAIVNAMHGYDPVSGSHAKLITVRETFARFTNNVGKNQCSNCKPPSVFASLDWLRKK